MELALKVRVIATKNGASLVENVKEDGTVRRVMLPSNLISRDGSVFSVSQTDFNMGIPFGLPLEDMLKDVTIQAKTLADTFHKLGLWTEQDFISRPNEVIAAFNSVAGHTLDAIYKAIKSYKKGDHDAY